MSVSAIKDNEIVRKLRCEIIAIGNDEMSAVRNAVMFDILVNTPMRYNAMVEMKFKDLYELDYEKKEVKIKINVHEELRELLMSYLLIRTHSRNVDGIFDAGKTAILRGYVFVKSNNLSNNHITREIFRRYLLKAGNACGLKNCGVNMLRRTYAYRQYRNGIKLNMLRRILKHSSLQITKEFIGEEVAS